jgi:hypothetical protein
MQRVRTALAWDYSVPPLLAAYDKAAAMALVRSRRTSDAAPALGPAPEE